MLADRRAAYEGLGLPLADGLAVEARNARRDVRRRRGRRGALRRGRGPRRGRRGAAHRGIGCGRIPAGRDDVLSYFVTGATGFIGRHLVEELLRNREGDVHVLVREDSREQARRAASRAGRTPSASSRSSATCSSRNLGHDDAWIEEHRGRDRALLPPRRDLRHDRAPTSQRARSTSAARATRSSSRTRSRPGTCTTSRRSPSTGEYQGPVPRGHVRRGPEAAVGLPPHEVRVRADRARAGDRAVARLPARDRRSATRRPARWTRSTGRTTSSSSSRRRATLLPQWFPLVGPELGWHEHRAGRLRRRAMDHIAHEPDLDGQAFHLMAPEVAALGRGAQHVRQGRARAAPRDAHRQAPHRRAAQGRRVADDRAAGAEERPARTILADLGHPRGGPRARRLHRAVRHARHRARAARARASRSRRSTATPTSIWDYWERNLDPDLFKDRSFEGAVNGRTVVITGASSGIGRAAAMKIARAGGIPLLVARSMDKLEETKAEIEAAGRDGVRCTRPTSPTSTRSTTSSSGCSPSTSRSTCSSTTPAARSAARSRSARTASTTSSARCGSTTSARSS